MKEVKIGDKVRITNMVGNCNEPNYNGREGTVYMIDKCGFIYGDWEGTFPINQKTDSFEIIKQSQNQDYNSESEFMMPSLICDGYDSNGYFSDNLIFSNKTAAACFFYPVLLQLVF